MLPHEAIAADEGGKKKEQTASANDIYLVSHASGLRTRCRRESRAVLCRETHAVKLGARKDFQSLGPRFAELVYQVLLVESA